MALYKNTTDMRGLTTSYHKIIHIALDTNFSPVNNELKMVIGLGSYADQSYRENDARNYLQVNHYSFELSMEEVNSEAIFTLAYKKLKTLNKFQDAIDV